MNKIPAGYKKTEVGIIPEDWKLQTLSSLAEISTGKTPPTCNKNYYGNEYFFVSPADLGNGKWIRKTEKKLSQLGFNISKKFAPKSILFTCIGSTIGKVGMADRQLTSNQQINAVIPNDSFSSDFLFSFLELFAFKIKKNASETAVPIINKTEFGNTIIVLPPTIEEQTAIATALNDADALITQLEKLIAKKRLIKQGAIQQLLKPKPGWQSKKLGEIAEVVGGGTPSTFTPSYWNGNINWFTPTEIGDKKYSYQSIRKITQEGFANSSAKLLSPGTILLTSRASIGDVSILMTEGCTNQGFQSLVAKEAVDSEFLYYLALTLKPILQQNASGSTFLEISPKKLKAISIKIPDKSQQISISQALSGIDKEIDALEAKLAKYKQIKQGMMQTLLTGKIRLL
ncbi:MAG TPA: restriction endonuclease subunit S [Candidatus Rifleibacterium sp.]|nr:restriction endonuclease subunit S [Candidatus Rifleibacterium sp.]